jgi:hypothetical protein
VSVLTVANNSLMLQDNRNAKWVRCDEKSETGNKKMGER